jgi:tetratricopeptide (TPR) repeat protein
MGNFFNSLLSPSFETSNSTEVQGKKEQKKFDMFKYDGLRASQIGEIQYAIKCYREALKIKEDKEIMQFLAAAYTSLHEIDEAVEVINRLVDLEPEDINVRLTRSGLYYQIEKNQEAIADCLHVIAIDEIQPAAWFLMGRAKKNLKDLTGAIADLTKAILLKNDFADAYLLRGEALFEANQIEEALLDLEKLIELAPEEEAAYLLRGRIYEHLGDIVAAADNYDQVVNLNPFNEDAFLLNGLLLIKKGKSEEAIALFDELLELNPEFVPAYRARGSAKHLIGNIKEAIEDEAEADKLEMRGKKKNTLEGRPANFNEMYKGGIF